MTIIALFSFDKKSDFRDLESMLNPAKTVIDICGGVEVAAAWAERTPARVRRWGYTRARGGSDGLVPSDCQVRLMNKAREHGVDLRPEHFFIGTINEVAA